MRKIITVISLLLLSGCGSAIFDFEKEVDKKKTVVVNSKVVSPYLPDIEIPIAPALLPVVFSPADEVNYRNWVINQVKTTGYVAALKNRIEEVNLERKKWRDENAGSVTK